MIVSGGNYNQTATHENLTAPSVTSPPVRPISTVATSNNTSVSVNAYGVPILIPETVIDGATVPAHCNPAAQTAEQRSVTEIITMQVISGVTQSFGIPNNGLTSYTTLVGPTTLIETVTQGLRAYRPWEAYYPDNLDCCQICSIYFPTVEVYYFPPSTMKLDCLGSTATITSKPSLSTGLPRVKRAGNYSIPAADVVDANGFTFQSPSIYVAFGDVSAGDACGPKGKEYSSVTLAFAPGELSTVEGKRFFLDTCFFVDPSLRVKRNLPISTQVPKLVPLTLHTHFVLPKVSRIVLSSNKIICKTSHHTDLDYSCRRSWLTWTPLGLTAERVPSKAWTLQGL